ncbi:ABC transporter substrate-binding protein [Paeniglutamicibacter cryotolerans]|uniref:Polar amino acid transport system substrate-binding protein n=1 Tax=Paeniglutamicibacter cryotolerans TaxID=670079 RepID=A0A839QG42_9MICC|nr:ABC transporter substrate-binding protein [Paeniglutamicibacter cryotolerans]MBB2995129.1 polar amino acid transport system substrate-binding protein [Paeniglutamicibacter cryotolerans]
MTNTTLGKMRSAALASAALIALLATSACGGQTLKEANNGAAAPAQAFTAVPAPEEDLAKPVIDGIKPNAELTAMLPEGIRSTGLKMTTSEGYPPMELFAQDGKTLIGVDPSVGRAIANKLGVPISVNTEDFNAQIPGITTGRYDILLSSMTDNEERRKTVTFVDYVGAGNGWVVKAGNPAGMGVPDSACGKTVAVVDNGSSFDLVKGFDKECKAAKKEGVEILAFAGDQDAILQVRNGRADAGINDFPVAAYRAQSSEGELEAVSIEGEKSPWGIAMNPDKKELISAVQKALQELIDDGTYTKVLGAWNVQDMGIEVATINDGK